MIEEIRREVVGSTWDGLGLPTATPLVTVGWNGGLKASQPSAVLREDKLVCALPRGGTANAYLLHPVVLPIGKLAVHITGHGNHYYDAATGCDLMTLGLLGAGYHVLAVPMPCMSFAVQPLVLSKVAGSTISLTAGSHVTAEFNSAEADGIACLRLFLDAAIIGIRYCIATLGPTSVDVTGLSGGGWTTDWLAAVYRVVRHSAPVFGSVPYSMRLAAGGPGDNGDWEQSASRLWWHPFQRSASATLEEVLYAMGPSGVVAGEPGENTGSLVLGVGRKRVQILGDDDPVFPSATLHTQIDAYAAWIRQISGSSGSVVLYDTTNAGLHKYTAWSVARVLELFAS